MIELKERFSTNKNNREIIEVLKEIVLIRNGKLLSCSESALKAKFGSMLMIRLFGAGVLQATNKQLPLIMDITIELQGKENFLDVYFADNLGRYIFRDPIAKRAYDKYITTLLSEMKKALQE